MNKKKVVKHKTNGVIENFVEAFKTEMSPDGKPNMYGGLIISILCAIVVVDNVINILCASILAFCGKDASILLMNGPSKILCVFMPFMYFIVCVRVINKNNLDKEKMRMPHNNIKTS